MRKKSLALLCVMLMLFSLLPVTASADSAIEKVLCTTSTIPVAQADSRDIYVNTSSSGCYVDSHLWRRTGDGYIIYQLFDTSNVELEITLRALDGWYFSDSVAVYLNNSRADFYIGENGKTLTLSRVYAPELWLPGIIKNPGSETVDEGGMASFIASATLTAEYKWYIIDPVSGESHPGVDIPSLFDGAYTGSMREGQFNIHNVPAAMDGWQVYCVFSGPGGEVKSSKASIKVNYETPPPTETPQPTPEPTAEQEAPAETPAPEQNAAPGHAHSFSQDWKHSEALHWRECECGAKTDEGVHSIVWEIQREATKREPGLSVGQCESCLYKTEKELVYDSANSILRYIILGLGGLVALTIIVLIVDSIAASRRRRRRRKKRRR